MIRIPRIRIRNTGNTHGMRTKEHRNGNWNNFFEICKDFDRNIKSSFFIGLKHPCLGWEYGLKTSNYQTLFLDAENMDAEVKPVFCFFASPGMVTTRDSEANPRRQSWYTTVMVVWKGDLQYIAFSTWLLITTYYPTVKSVADRDVDTLNLDLDSEFRPNLNQDPGLCNKFWEEKNEKF